MAQASLPTDTDPEVFDVLVACWRSMSIADRVALIDQLNSDVETMAVAGIKRAQPDLDEYQLRHALAIRRFGRALADDAYSPQPAG